MRYLADNADALADFNQWIDDNLMVRSWMVVNQAQTMDEIIGLRFLIAEFTNMRDFINQPFYEAAARRQVENGGNTDPMGELADYLKQSNAPGYRATGNGFERPG